jgi:hypothetical protein
MFSPLPMRSASVLVGILALFAGLGGTRTVEAAAQDAKSSDVLKPMIKFEHPVVFTMAIGDPATNGKIAVLMANRLRENGKRNAGPVRSDAWIVPQGQWSLGDYLDQCKRDSSHTRGAFIVLPPASSNSSENYIALLRSSTDVTLSIMVAECHAAAAAPAPSAAAPAAVAPAADGETSVVWASYAQSGKYGRTQIEFFPLAVLTSVYLAFSPQRTYQTTTTSVYPTIAPIPAGGERTSVQTQQSNVLNPSGTAGLQGNVLTAFAGNGLGSTIGGNTGPEVQAVRAADDAIGHLLNEQLNRVCAAPQAPPQPNAPPSLPPMALPAPNEEHPFCSW